MKKIFCGFQLFILLFLMGMTIGCVELSPIDNTPDSPIVIVPKDFDWKMVNELSCTVRVASFSGVDDNTIHIINIYNNSLLNDGALVASGAATPSSPFEIKISLAKTVQTIYVQEILPDGTTNLQIKNVTGNALDINSSTSVASNAPVSLRSVSDVDIDGDGVAAGVDVDDNDATVAHVSYFPSEGTWGTFTFEDLWPIKGDYDVNDMVLGFRISYYTNSANKVTKLRFDYNMRAAGCLYDLATAFQLDNVTAANVASITGQELIGTSPFAVSANGTESGVSLAVIPLFNNQRDVVLFTGYLNTENGKYVTTPDKFVSIKFVNPVEQSNLTMSKFNMFIVVNERGREIHLPTYQGTTKFNSSLGNGYDLDPGDKFKNADGMMWGLMIPEPFEYPSERSLITSAYLHFSDWASSGGTTNLDWYNPIAGNTNNAFIYSVSNAEYPGDYDGNVYHTITIGTQVWMLENLKVTRYRNGDPIPNVTVNASWGALNTGAYCDYNNTASNGTTYGKLYNWFAVSDARNLAPIGWHVPTDTEWTTLTTYLTNNGYGFEGSGSDIAKSMASTSGWTSDATAGNVGNDQATNNSSGFTGLPGGYRTNAGTFLNMGTHGYIWSSTEYSSTNAWRRLLQYNNSTVVRISPIKIYGFSVRCIRD